MTLTYQKRPTIGLVEVPATGLYDADGKIGHLSIDTVP